MTDREELETIADMLEADGDEWNVCNSLRRIAARTGGEVEPEGVPAGTTYLPVITENLLSEYGDTELVENGQWSQLAVDFSCDIPVKKYPPQAAKVLDMKWLKEACTSFFYWWHNQPGANTQQGFDDWVRSDEVKRMLTAAPKPVGDGEWKAGAPPIDEHALMHIPLRNFPHYMAYGFVDKNGTVLDCCGDDMGWTSGDINSHYIVAQPPEGDR